MVISKVNDFWRIIGTNDLTTSATVTVALARVKARLAATASSVAHLREFDQWLEEQLRQLDRKDFFDSPVISSEGKRFRQTDDHFLYSRCACILTGATAMAEVLAGRRSFIDFTAIPLQRAELLLYLAKEIGEKPVWDEPQEERDDPDLSGQDSLF